jgi:hypothetical protein
VGNVDRNGDSKKVATENAIKQNNSKKHPTTLSCTGRMPFTGCHQEKDQ